MSKNNRKFFNFTHFTTDIEHSSRWIWEDHERPFCHSIVNEKDEIFELNFKEKKIVNKYIDMFKYILDGGEKQGRWDEVVAFVGATEN
jgi:hypothetical protein